MNRGVGRSSGNPYEFVTLREDLSLIQVVFPNVSILILSFGERSIRIRISMTSLTEKRVRAKAVPDRERYMDGTFQSSGLVVC